MHAAVTSCRPSSRRPWTLPAKLPPLRAVHRVAAATSSPAPRRPPSCCPVTLIPSLCTSSCGHCTLPIKLRTAHAAGQDATSSRCQSGCRYLTSPIKPPPLRAAAIQRCPSRCCSVTLPAKVPQPHANATSCSPPSRRYFALPPQNHAARQVDVARRCRYFKLPDNLTRLHAAKKTLKYVNTLLNCSDILTKPLGRGLFERHRKNKSKSKPKLEKTTNQFTNAQHRRTTEVQTRATNEKSQDVGLKRLNHSTRKDP